MSMKRFLALPLAGALLAGLLVLPAGAAEGTAFTDITDPDVAEAAETLRLLGVVSGTGSGAFEPGRTLTRAEFCKMAVELMGNGDKVASQMDRTIFQDVPGTHWARGYIAVATQTTTSGSGEDAAAAPGIIRGDAYGNFNPDRPITYAEAVTILVRILGYGDNDVGMVWPNGYLAKAAELDLTGRVEGLTAGDDLTRGQTALLMEDLLFTDKKGSDQEYITSLGCTTTDETIIFDVDATAPDGSPALEVSQKKVYKTDHAPFDQDLVGRRAKLVLDEDEKVIAVERSDQGTQMVVGILSLEYDRIRVSGGEDVEIEKPKEAVVWKDGEETTYEQLYLSGVPSGTQALLQYSAAGELDYIFLRQAASSNSSTTQVVKNRPNYSGEASYAVYKNGVSASVQDIRQYDVTTFDRDNDILYVSDARVTGIYENVYPNQDTPATITVLGHDFPVLSSAAADLRGFKVGDSITLLLSYNGQVAGAVDPGTARSTAVGTVTSIQNGTATVTSINLKDENGKPLTFTGGTSYSGQRAEEMVGQLVTVSSGSKGRISLSRLSGEGASAPMDVAGRRIGSVALADNVKLYEQVGRSTLAEIELEDIALSTVPASKITYVRQDYAGNADIVVFNDVTGDRYDYGFSVISSKYAGEDTNPTPTVAVRNAAGTTSALLCPSGVSIPKDRLIGVVTGQPRTDGEVMLETYVELLSAQVPSDAFDMDEMTVTVRGAVIPVADRVMCYNDTTDTWFTVGSDAEEEDYKDALNRARAFSDTVTVYYDKAPDQGGKVRVVVAG